jgi:DNA polymerase-1
VGISSPNFAAISRDQEFSRCIVAGKGRKIVYADFSQAELRILAHISQDAELVKNFTAEVEGDIHYLTAAKLYGIPVGNVTKEQRHLAKSINFGLSYGMTHWGLIAKCPQLTKPKRTLLLINFSEFIRVSNDTLIKRKEIPKFQDTLKVFGGGRLS